MARTETGPWTTHGDHHGYGRPMTMTTQLRRAAAWLHRRRRLLAAYVAAVGLLLGLSFFLPAERHAVPYKAPQGVSPTATAPEWTEEHEAIIQGRLIACELLKDIESYLHAAEHTAAHETAQDMSAHAAGSDIGADAEIVAESLGDGDLRWIPHMARIRASCSSDKTSHEMLDSAHMNA